MSGTVAPFPKHQFFDDAGNPAAGYKLFCYAAGSTVKQTTYSDAGLTVPNTNPVIMDSAGRCTLFLPGATYNFVFARPTDTDPPGAPLWTIDNVPSTAVYTVQVDIPVSAGQPIAAGDVVYMSQGVGGLTIGRWYKTDADLDYASAWAPLIGIAPGGIGSGDNGTARLMGRIGGLTGLQPGFRYYVGLAAGSLSGPQLPNQRLVGYADSTTSLVLTPDPLKTRSMVIEFGAPGAGVLTSGVQKYVQVSNPILLTGWTLLAEQVGSIVIDVVERRLRELPTHRGRQHRGDGPAHPHGSAEQSELEPVDLGDPLHPAVARVGLQHPERRDHQLRGADAGFPDGLTRRAPTCRPSRAAPSWHGVR
jgi:hypothetical protein